MKLTGFKFNVTPKAPFSIKQSVLALTLKSKSSLGNTFFQPICFRELLRDNPKGLQIQAFFKGQCYLKSK